MNQFKVTFYVILALALSLVLGSVADAMESPSGADNMPNIVGVVVAVVPDYLGSDDTKGVGAPFFRWSIQRERRYLQLLGTELSFNMSNSPTYEFGPVLNYRAGRDDDVDDEVVKKMTKIDDTVELGIMGAYKWMDKANPRHRFSVKLEVLGDLGDAYEGWLAMVGASYWFQVNRPIDIMIGFGTTYGNSDYMETYFGVDSADALATGLSQFDADSGLRDFNIPVAMVFHFSQNWHVTAGIKYFKLLNDASDSPVTDDRGSSDQIFAGLGGVYSW